MIRKLLKQGEIGDLKALLSPAFFDVMSTRDILRTAGVLLKNYRSNERFGEVRDDLTRLATRNDLRVTLTDEASGSGTDPDTVLRLYFLQLFCSPTTILDLRSPRFAQREDDLAWSPAPVFYTWDPEFREDICAMYRAFYRGSDSEFDDAVEKLGLRGAADLFRRHFGGGDQGAVRFEIAEFTATFRKIFEHCEAEGISLRPDFGPLGAYLASLYEHLETHGGAHDVRAAAEWALQARAL